MSNKKDGLHNRLWNLIELQALRLDTVISKFYPDGARAKFVKPIQVGEIVKGSPAFQPYKKDARMQEKLIRIRENVRNKRSGSTLVDFSHNYQNFQGHNAIAYNVSIMFKITPQDSPIYLHDKDEEIEEGLAPRFFIDADAKEAYLLLEDADYRFEKSDDNDKSFFTKLSEFHAIFSGYYDDGNADDEVGVCYLTSFSEEDGICLCEEIIDFNKCIINRVFPPIEEINNSANDAPASNDSVEPEAVTVNAVKE